MTSGRFCVIVGKTEEEELEKLKKILRISRRYTKRIYTPGIIKFNFWQYTKENPNAFYACINKDEAYCPEEIADQAVCMDVDIGEALRKLV